MKQITQFFLEDKRDEGPTFNDLSLYIKRKVLQKLIRTFTENFISQINFNH